MSSKITTVSLSLEDFDLISQYNLSPSALIKEKLGQFRQVDTFAAIKIKELNAKVARLAKIVQEQAAFMEAKGIYDKYLEKEDVVEERI